MAWRSRYAMGGSSRILTYSPMVRKGTRFKDHLTLSQYDATGGIPIRWPNSSQSITRA